MPAFQQRTVIIGYKLRIKNKFKSVVEETENVVGLLRSCVSSFTDRVNKLLDNNDENFLKLYQKLNDEFEKYQEKLFFIHASLENPDAESINEVSEEETNQQIASKNDQVSQTSRTQSISGQTHANFIAPSQTSSLSSSSFCSLQDVCDSVPVSLKEKNGAANVHCDPSIQSHKNLQNVETDILQSSELQQESSHSLSRNSFYSFSSNISAIKPQSASSSITDSLNCDIAENDKQSVAQSITHPSTPVSSRPTSLILPSAISIPSVISATLTHVINPDDFWMQLENSKGYVLTFPSSLVADSDPPSFIQPGDYCLAPFKSIPVYYRAKIMTEISEDHTVEVFFIDHGSTHGVTVWDLRPLPADLYKVPMQAVHCCLSDIIPINGAWTRSSVDKLKEFQNNTLETHVKSLKSSDTGYKYAVQLIATISALFSEDFSCDIAQALCIDGLAIFDEVSLSVQESASEMCNQRSCDSGVSVTSNQRASPCTPVVYNSSDVLENCSISSFVPANTLQKEAYVKSEHLIATDACAISETQDLISFDSEDAMNCPSARNTNKNALIGECLRTVDCDCEWHVEVPPPSIMFVEKDMMLVMVCHIINPNEFYVNLAMPDSISLDDLRDQMTSTYESTNLNFRSLFLGDLKEGMYLAARFEQDGHWYRVKILRINAESERTCDAYVQYIDYGNKAFVKCGDLRPLLPQFAEAPSFAIKCSLAGVTPKDKINCTGENQSESQGWSCEAIQKFKELVSFERCLTAQICELRNSRSAPGSAYASYENKPLQVLLWDTEGAEDVLINEIFSESDQARFHNNILKIIEENAKLDAKEAEILNHWDPMREEFEGVENSYGVCMDDPSVAIAGYKPRDESYICRYFSLRGYCPRGDSCSLEHIPLAEGGVTRDQEEVYALDPIPALPKSSTYVMVQVSAVINPGLFYCILPFGDKTVDEVDALANRGRIKEVWMKDEIKALFKDMREYYSNAPFTENTTVALSFGTIVVAWRRVDCSWHRARVLDVSDVTGPARVFFVDFGDEDWVPRKKIRQILPQFFYTPFQAVECHLSDVEPLGFESGKRWTPEAIYHFQQLVSYEVLLAHVIYRSENILHVTLTKTKENDHCSISESLVNEGFAQYVAFSASPKKESLYVPG
ncbi:tudor domain-containing protein 6-like isoform X2 [Argiope bruennichi]|uniref:tudor domain-containing protein 6-like isoform X2 n=1 Tax=Argiope bruennichi TaxID=94029 RepID=UPI0024959B39|nr:tudor domain-containing protein 6-like isoform X2 [Argiope bruennichi]